MRNCYHVIFGLALSVFGPIAAMAHEAWIDTVRKDIAPGERLEANIRVGENLRGGTQIFNPDSYQNLVYAVNRKVQKITGNLGDRPAIQIPDAVDGLHILVLQSRAQTLRYKSLEKFAAFVTRHDQAHTLDAHAARGLPEADFRESYFRFAKALIKVGDGTGADAMAGLPFELTALDNPYTTTGPIRFRLTYQRKRVPDFQIDVFHRAPGVTGDAALTFLRTDAEGIVTIPRAKGDFLISAVLLEEPNDRIKAQLDVVWQSLWASSTYWIE